MPRTSPRSDGDAATRDYDIDASMNWVIALFDAGVIGVLLIFLVISAGAAIAFRNVLNSVLALSVFSIVLALLFVIYQAPDAAMAEAVVGAGLVTALFLVTISKTGSTGGDG